MHPVDRDVPLVSGPGDSGLRGGDVNMFKPKHIARYFVRGCLALAPARVG